MNNEQNDVKDEDYQRDKLNYFINRNSHLFIKSAAFSREKDDTR